MFGRTLAIRFLRTKALLGAIATSALLMAACGVPNASSGNGSGTSGSSANSSLTACHVAASDLKVSGSSSAAAAPTPTSGISGKNIAVDGSSALGPLFVKAATTFDPANGTHTVDTANGSGNGLKDVESGAVQIGLSDFYKEQSATPSAFGNLVDHRVAVVAFTLVVSKDIANSVENLTVQQIKDIYTGKITNWSQIGGPNEAVTVVNRPLASGTRATFKQYVLGGVTESAGTTLTQDTTGAVATKLSSSQGAIGYVATGFVLDPSFSGSIFPICIDGYGATASNINTGKYLYWSYEHAYTKGQPSTAAGALIDYVESDAVQSTDVPALGYLKVSDLTSAAKATHPAPSSNS